MGSGCAVIGDDGLCRCDVFDELHTPGLVEGDAYCETLYTAPTVSPHIFGVAPDGSRFSLPGASEIGSREGRA